MTLRTFVDYCALLILYGVGKAIGFHDVWGTDGVMEVARQAWFTIWMMGGYRVIYSQLNT